MFFSGLGAGMLAAYFLTPTTGPQNRRLFRRRVRNTTEYLQDAAHDVKKTVARTSGTLSEALETGKETLRSAVDQGKLAMEKVLG
jgi:gas vesicle protein